MNQAELTHAVSKLSKLRRRDVHAVFIALAAVTYATVKDGGDVAVPGLCKIKPKTRDARTGRNPRTGDVVDIPQKLVAKFVTAKSFDDHLQA